MSGSEQNKPVGPNELDRMTPDERATAVRDRLVTNPEELPHGLRNRIFETARRLSGERTTAK